MTTGAESTPKPAPRARPAGKGAKERVRTPPLPGSMADLYREVLPALDFEAEQTKWDVALTVAPQRLHSVLATSQRDERLAMDLLRNLTAVDWEEEGLEVVYHLLSTRHHHSVAIKTRVPSESPSLPTVTDIWRGAEWAEREAREMFGIEFAGHPDPRNLLLDEDIDIHPLRKSHPLAAIEIPQGVDVEFFRREHPAEEAAAAAPAEEAAPADDERASRIAAAKKLATGAAAGGAGERKPDTELTPEELAAKKAAQTERVKQARELAAASRAAKRAGGEPPAAAKPAQPSPSVEPAAAPAAGAPAAEAPAPAATASAPATPQAPAAAPTEEEPAAEAAPAEPAPSETTPLETAPIKPSADERVRRARELAAARRAELKREGG